MKIVVAGGTTTAEYIIKNFNNRENSLTIINNDKRNAVEIAKNNDVPVFYGDPSKRSILEAAHAENSDIFISVNEDDSTNFVACMLAKKVLNAKKVICIVSNPNNVDVFKELGVDAVISSTQLLIDSINSESSLETLIKTMSFEDNKISLTEVVIKASFLICRKQISEISFPKEGSISCIYRKPRVIIPNGQTVILPKDKLLFVSAPKDKDDIIDFITREK